MIRALILYTKLRSICARMGENLRRTSRSPLIAEDGAFATAIMTADLRLAVQVQGEPSHLYALRESVRHLFDYFAFDIPRRAAPRARR